MIPVLADELGRRSPGAARAPGRGPRRWKKKNRQFLAKPADARYCFSEIAVLAFRWTGAPTGLNSGQMVRKNVALVLGGGGSAGHAWLIGIIAGLAEAGLDRMAHGPGRPGRRPAQAGQPRRGDHAGRRFRSRNGHEPDGSGDPHPHRPCRFRPRQAGSDPRDIPLTIARRRPALHPQL
jgi:hypothetical protein